MKKSAKTKKKKVTFNLKAIDAAEVYLVSNFNGWNTKSHPMKKLENGIWQKQVELPTGKYEYKFLVDGEWQVDPDNDHTCNNSLGTQNSVLDFIVK